MLFSCYHPGIAMRCQEFEIRAALGDWRGISPRSSGMRIVILEHVARDLAAKGECDGFIETPRPGSYTYVLYRSRMAA
jgi:hypothetical protein